MREQERRLDSDKLAIMSNMNLIAEEKQRIVVEMEDRARELHREKEAQRAVAQKIRAMESKLLSGDTSLEEKTRVQQALLEKQRLQLQEQDRKSVV